MYAKKIITEDTTEIYKRRSIPEIVSHRDQILTDLQELFDSISKVYILNGKKPPEYADSITSSFVLK
ncbi:hypothetical protein B1J93_08900 [Leptospira kirschneri serovar Pomona]|uniref:Uncharacterized protein n=1 Tax=Leptospira kirschneri serovar Pomona TaxID=561005 RepID=A0A1T1DQS6_9LEPT|nr:hypothetical protein B1J93_08900 [Leptospira kirschneri serovar Pomona]